MKTTTIALGAGGIFLALFLLNRSQSGASGGVLGSLGSLGQIPSNLIEGATTTTDLAKNIATAFDELSKAGIQTAQSLGSTIQAFAGAGQNVGQALGNITQTGENLTTIPMQISSNIANISTQASEHISNVFTISNKTGLKGQANAGDAVKNFFTGRWF